MRRQAQQTARKLLSSLGGFKLAYGLLEELKTVLSSHKVRASSGPQNWGSQTPELPLPALWDLTWGAPWLSSLTWAPCDAKVSCPAPQLRDHLVSHHSFADAFLSSRVL